MSPTSCPTPARLGCTACPGSENATLDVRKDLSSPINGSGSVGRTLGRRSLDAFSSIRGSLKGHRTLHPTTNQKPASSTMTASAGNSPNEAPAKQRWFDSLRGNASQIPTPLSPTSMSPTLKRSRFLWSAPNLPPEDDPSSPTAAQTRLRDHLPQLQIASFRSELQRTPLFGEITGETIVDVSKYLTRHSGVMSKVLADQAPESNTASQNNTHKKTVRIQTELPLGANSDPQSQATASDLAAGAGPVTSEPAAVGQDKSIEKTSSATAIASATAAKKSSEPWRILCDLYYKGTPWKSELKKTFSDADTALTQFALRNMLTDQRDCSNTLLWTSEIQMATRQVNQTFTVYPLIDGPKRTEIQKNYDLHWAIITFTDGPPVTKTNTTMREEDKRLTKAVRKITSMGYHVDVWTYLDDDGWYVDLILAEAELAREPTEDKHMRRSSRSPSVLLDYQHLDRRRRYEFFLRDGVPGFLQADLDLLDKLRRETLLPERPGWNRLQEGAKSELMGFLEHTEETIMEAD